MKKLSSLKKKLVAFGLAVCTFVTSNGVNECAAAGNATQQNQNQQEGWSVGGTIKWLLNRGVELSVLYVAYRLGLLTYIFHHHESAGDILLYLSSLIGTGVVINKVKSIPSNIKDEFCKKQNKRNELKEKRKKLVSEWKRNHKESLETLGEEFTLLPKKVVTAGATVVSGARTFATIGAKVAAFGTKGAIVGAKCAVPVMKYAGKAAFLGVKELWNLLDWIKNG